MQCKRDLRRAQHLYLGSLCLGMTVFLNACGFFCLLSASYYPAGTSKLVHESCLSLSPSSSSSWSVMYSFTVQYHLILLVTALLLLLLLMPAGCFELKPQMPAFFPPCCSSSLPDLADQSMHTREQRDSEVRREGDSQMDKYRDKKQTQAILLRFVQWWVYIICCKI